MYVELGKIVGVWGVKGWVKLHSFTRSRTDIATYKKWYLARYSGDGTVSTDAATPVSEFVVAECRQQGQGMVAQLQSVNDRDQAEKLNGLAILVKADDLPALAAGEYYWHELVGLDVFIVDEINGDQLVGCVNSIIETGANDVLVVASSKAGQEGEQDILIPYVPDVVKQVDLKANRVTVDWSLDYLTE